MRNRSKALLAIGVLVAAGLPVGAAAAAAEPPANIYVSTTCQTGADGTEDLPFCSIPAAAAVAQPGQTINVEWGSYGGSVSPPSGEPGKPITFKGYRGPNGRTELHASQAKPPFVLSGVHDVVIDGFEINAPGQSVVVIENSSDITVSNGWLTSSAAAGVDIKGASRRVTISGMTSRGNRAPLVSVGAGVSDTTLTGNSLNLSRGFANAPVPAISVTDAPGTTVTNNTIVTDCLAGVEVTGASTKFALYNTIVRTVPVGRTTCTAMQNPDPAGVVAVSVDSAATADSHADYNLIDPLAGGQSYSWGGTAYATPAAFHAATGLGANDIGGDAKLANVDPIDTGWSLTGDSPAVDSGWASAPGLLAADLRGNAHADKPDAPNSGGGYVDRGSAEFMPAPTYTTTISRVRGGGALETSTTVTATYPWTLDGPIGFFSFAAPGQRTVVNRTGTARLTFPRAGFSCSTAKVSLDGFRGKTPAYDSSPCLMLGAAFNAVTPQRVLDTRAAVGTERTTPLAPHEGIAVPLPALPWNVSAVVLNVTVANPTANGYLKVFPYGQAEPIASNINFVKNQTIPNLVTVPVFDGKIDITNGSSGFVHVLADVAGYYANTGLGLTSAAPVRVLDTRSAVGVPGTTPLGPNGRVTVDLSARVPVGTTAVALNVAVTKPTGGGHLTAFPPGGAVPATSNLNFVTGQTANNMVIAPVVDRKIAFAYGGGGTVHVLAELTGYFAPGIADTYLPLSPLRILDTRNTGVSVGPGKTVRVFVNADECMDAGCPRTAVVANLTVTNTQSSGYLTVYPYGQARPVASVLNFNTSETIANLVTVRLGEDSFLVYNNSGAPVDVVVDQAGFYLPPPA